MRNRTNLAAVWPPTAGVARAAGHDTAIYPLEAVRAKCLDCCGGQAAEVRLCEAVSCALWPFRAGRHPVGRREVKKTETVPVFREGEAIGEGPDTALKRNCGGRP